MQRARAVFFDVDGVLLDSLPAHLRICQDLSREFGLGLTIPTLEEFRELSRSGLPLSPMEEFFMTVGFTHQDAHHAAAFYERHFHERYPVGLFPLIGRLLEDLHETGVLIGVATANVQLNVETALGDHWSLFDPRLRFTYDHPVPGGKAGALRAGARELGVDSGDVIFVGDQLTDQLAASQAGVRFLGVTYGWGISREDRGFDLVHQPEELAAYFLTERKEHS